MGGAPAPGRVAHRPLPGPDDGLLIRTSDELLLLAPHGGVALHAVLSAALRDVLGEESPVATDPASLQARWPEARTLAEACALDTLGHVRGSLAAGVLLKQAALWGERNSPGPSMEHDHALRHLLSPPLVAVIGPANAGKSTLVNALAGRPVSVVDPRAGTTRDHVGVHVGLMGLHVVVVDLPGTRAESDAIEREATAIAARLLQEAALVIRARAPGQAHATLPREVPASAAILQAFLQCDRAVDDGPAEGELPLSAAVGTGMDRFARRVRDELVDPAAIASDRRWRFHPALRGPAGAQRPTIE